MPAVGSKSDGAAYTWMPSSSSQRISSSCVGENSIVGVMGMSGDLPPAATLIASTLSGDTAWLSASEASTDLVRCSRYVE